MTTQQERRNLFNELEGALNLEAAHTLMELLPITPASQLVTRDDMHANTVMLRGEMAELRAELRGEMVELRAGLRCEMVELRGEVKRGIAEVQTEMNRRFEKISDDLGLLRSHTTRTVVLAAVANAITLIGVGIIT